MNIHKNARLTFIRRVEMVHDVVRAKLPVCQVAAHYEVSAGTVRKWVGRFLAEGRAGLTDRSSRPLLSPRAIDGAEALTVVELRKKRMTQARIAQYLSLSTATVSPSWPAPDWFGCPIWNRPNRCSVTSTNDPAT